MREIFFLIIETLGGLYVGVCLLRVLLQASRADYYNPLSQFIVKATGLPVRLLRTVAPPIGRLDTAALIWAVIAAILVTEALALTFGRFVAPLSVMAWAAIGLLNLTLTLYFYGLIIVIIISFLVALGGLRISHPSLDLLNQLIRPVLEPFSRLLPPMGGIDLSPILLFLAIRVLQILVYNLADSAGVTPAVVIGI